MSKTYEATLGFSTIVSLIVDADSEEEAIEKAREKYEELSSADRNEVEAEMLSNLDAWPECDHAEVIKDE